MQQLKLFKSYPAPSKRRKRHTRKSVDTKRMARPDLFSDETSPEKEMALFFLDIRNFTPLAARHEAMDVIHLVRRLFASFQNIIRLHHGRIIETSGDGFYAAFGIDRDPCEAINGAVQAGKTILRTLDSLNQSIFEEKLNQRVEVGIGVHCGKVATGNLTLGGKDHFVVMGYPVNIASRIQAATKELNNSFIVSETVFRQLGEVDSHQKVNTSLKGVAEPLDLYLIGKPYAA